jgi:hypothetical protein
MIMALPFLLGLIAAICAVAGQRRAAIGVWALLAIVLLAWLKYHATSSLGLSF